MSYGCPRTFWDNSHRVCQTMDIFRYPGMSKNILGHCRCRAVDISGHPRTSWDTADMGLVGYARFRTSQEVSGHPRTSWDTADMGLIGYAGLRTPQGVSGCPRTSWDTADNNGTCGLCQALETLGCLRTSPVVGYVGYVRLWTPKDISGHQRTSQDIPQCPETVQTWDLLVMPG